MAMEQTKLLLSLDVKGHHGAQVPRSSISYPNLVVATMSPSIYLYQSILPPLGRTFRFLKKYHPSDPSYENRLDCPDNKTNSPFITTCGHLGYPLPSH